MPTTDGTISGDEQMAIALAINARAADSSDPCPNCKRTPSQVLPYLARVNLGQVEDLMRGFSAAVTVCTECGFVRMFSVDVLKVPGHPGLVPMEYQDPGAIDG